MAFAVGYKTFTTQTTGAQNVALSGFTDVVGTIGSLQANDYVLVWYGHFSNTSRSLAQCTPSGYTAAQASATVGSDTAVTTGAASYKKQGVTPDANVAIPGTNSTSAAATAYIVVIRGADPTTFLDVTTTTASGINGGRPNPPAITPSTAGSLIIGFGAASSNVAMAAFVQAGDYNNFVSTQTTVGIRPGATGMGLKTDWVSGSFDAGAWTGGNTDLTSSWVSVTLALRPDATSTVVDPATGHQVYTGYAPTVARTTNQLVAPFTGHQVYAGRTPTVLLNQQVAPVTGHLTYDGKVPTVTRTANQTVAPATGHLLYSGYAPVVARSANQAVAPATGHLTYTGYSLGITQTTFVSPAAGHLVYSGKTPTVFVSNNTNLSPGTGHLVYSGKTPGVLQPLMVAPASGHLVYGGKAPAVTQSASRSVDPATGHLAYSGKVPAVTQSDNAVVAPLVGHLFYTGRAPGVAQTTSQNILPSTGHLVYRGYTPSVTQSGGGGGDQFRVGGETVQALFQTDKIAFPWDVRMKTNT